MDRCETNAENSIEQVQTEGHRVLIIIRMKNRLEHAVLQPHAIILPGFEQFKLLILEL